jgi:hypothetical protein
VRSIAEQTAQQARTEAQTDAQALRAATANHALPSQQTLLSIFIS